MVSTNGVINLQLYGQAFGREGQAERKRQGHFVNCTLVRPKGHTHTEKRVFV